MLPLVTLVVPVYNEEVSIAPFIAHVKNALAPLLGHYRFCVLFVNDGSLDTTEEKIHQQQTEHPDLPIGLINLARNFGKEAALMAGLHHAQHSDAIIPIDVDLQDPPEVIPLLLEQWEKGAQIVNAKRRSRAGDSFFKAFWARAFYALFNRIAVRPIASGVGDFRLLDRQVVHSLCQINERARCNKEIFSWVGYPTAQVLFDRPERFAGHSQWSYVKLIKLALDAIFASSTLPLRIWTLAGLFFSMAAFFYALFLVVRTLVLGIDTPGYASTAVLILTFGGLNMLALGIIGEYVGRIYHEVRARPLYIVRSVISPHEPPTGES